MVGWGLKWRTSSVTALSCQCGHGVKISTEKVLGCCGFDHGAIHFYVDLGNCVSLGCSSRVKKKNRTVSSPQRNETQCVFQSWKCHSGLGNYNWASGWVNNGGFPYKIWSCTSIFLYFITHSCFYFLYFITHSFISNIPTGLWELDQAPTFPFGGKGSQD